MEVSDTLSALVIETLDAQLGRLWQHSDFYRERWSSAGFVSAPRAHELRDLPMLSKDDLRVAQDASSFLGAYRVCDEREVAHVCATSGTSGRPTYFGLTAGDMDDWIRIFERGFQVAGLRAGQRVLHAFAMSRGYAGGVPMIAALQSMGCVAYAIGAEAGSSRLSDALDRLRPDVLYATPSLVRHLARRYEEESGKPASGTTVRLILTGGEPGAGDAGSRARIAELWGASVRELAGGSDICPLMWSECDQQNGLHFVAEDSVAVELLDLESQEPVATNGPAVGELIYTHLRRIASPLVRMRHADAVTFDPTPCSCGLDTPRIKFIGRTDDMLIVRGVKVFPSAVQAAIAEFQPPLTGAVSVDPDSAEKGILHIYCETMPETLEDESVQPNSVVDRVQARVREVLGVRTLCSLVPAGALIQEGSAKSRWRAEMPQSESEPRF